MVDWRHSGNCKCISVIQVPKSHSASQFKMALQVNERRNLQIALRLTLDSVELCADAVRDVLHVVIQAETNLQVALAALSREVGDLPLNKFTFCRK